MPEQGDARNFINLADGENRAADVIAADVIAADAIAADVTAGDDERDARDLPDEGLDLVFLLPDASPKPTVQDRFGQAILRLRLYRGWTQRDLQRSCGVHQSQISRLETGRSPGISMRRVYAILRALHADTIDFLPAKPAIPPTALELMLWGDLWERAGRAAERRRLSRRRSA